MSHPKFGKTGKLPQGKVHESDEGELTFGVAADFEHGVVVFNFGTPVAWMGLAPSLARQLGESLIKKAQEMESHPLPGLPV